MGGGRADQAIGSRRWQANASNLLLAGLLSVFWTHRRQFCSFPPGLCSRTRLSNYIFPFLMFLLPIQEWLCHAVRCPSCFAFAWRRSWNDKSVRQWRSHLLCAAMFCKGGEGSCHILGGYSETPTGGTGNVIVLLRGVFLFGPPAPPCAAVRGTALASMWHAFYFLFAKRGRIVDIDRNGHRDSSCRDGKIALDSGIYPRLAPWK